MNWPLITVGVIAGVTNFVTGRLVYWQQRLISAQKRQLAAKDETIATLRESVDLSDACGSIITNAWNRQGGPS